MDLATISMDRNEARKAFLEYRRAVRARHDAEDEAIMRGYRELANGRQLLKLSETIRAGGFDERVSMPRLAICRADAEWVEGWLTGDRQITYTYPGTSRWGRAARGKRFVIGEVVPEHIQTFSWGRTVQAIVPTV